MSILPWTRQSSPTLPTLWLVFQDFMSRYVVESRTLHFLFAWQTTFCTRGTKWQKLFDSVVLIILKPITGSKKTWIQGSENEMLLFCPEGKSICPRQLDDTFWALQLSIIWSKKLKIHLAYRLAAFPFENLVFSNWNYMYVKKMVENYTLKLQKTHQNPAWTYLKKISRLIIQQLV